MKIIIFSSILFSVPDRLQPATGEESTNPNSPKVVEAKGYIVPKDILAGAKKVLAGNPKIVKAGNPEVVMANTNVFPAGVPKVVMAGSPKIFTPGEDTILLPRSFPAVGHTYVGGIPEMVMVKDAHMKDINPRNFSSFGKLQGLKNDIIQCIFQDKSGNLWFGTGGGGATRYDGKSFTHFTEKEGMPHNIVTEIKEDNKGNLWFSTWGGGVCRYNGKSFTQYSEKEGFIQDVVLSMLQEKNGNLWFGTQDKGVCKYDGKSFTNFGKKEGFCNTYVLCGLQDRNDNLWFGTLDGLYRYNGKSFALFTKNEGLASDNVFSLFEDSNGILWIGTGNGVCRFDGKSFAHFTKKEGLSHNHVSSIIEDKQGKIWFSTRGGGINLYDGKSFTHFTEKEGLVNDFIYHVFQDRSGNILAGGEGGGVSRYDGKTLSHFTMKEGLSDNRVISIFQDKSGNLWFGTISGGVNRYDGRSFMHFTKKEGFSNIVISSIIMDKTGNLWFSTWGDGVFRYDGKSFAHFTSNEGLSTDMLMDIVEDNNGNLWFGTDGEGICLYDGKYFTYITDKEGLNASGIMCARKDKSGNLWFASSDSGLNCYNGKSFTRFTTKEGLSNNRVGSIFEDKHGYFWFGTRGGGVCRYDGKSFMILTEKEGLCNNDVTSISEDKTGNLLFGTPTGLSRLCWDYMMKLARTSEKGIAEPPVIFKNFTYEDGFLGIGCFIKSILEDDKGTIWIGANDRLTAYYPDGDEPDTLAPDIQLTGIQLFNENIPWLNFEKNKDTSLVLGNGVTIKNFVFDSISPWYYLPLNLSLAHNNNFLTFLFTGITQKQNKKVKYKYKLDGFDENWSSISTRTEAPYGNLPYGNYSFKVKAMNSEGYWSNEFNYSFTIRPPWWETWWAYMVYILIIIAGIWAVIYSTIEFQRRKIRLIVNERNRISRELHDDIGAELSRITVISQLLQKKANMDSENKEKLRKISEAGKKVLGSIGEIIWTMNPQKDNLDSLLAYVRRFVTEYLETNGIEVMIEFPDEIPAKAVSDEYRRNVFLVIKEATYNITKYSKATRVRLSMKLREKMADFEIADNGTGFSLKEKREWGNGLTNMSQRMKDIGGDFQIRSDENQGTIIKLTFPVH